ncbi:MAG TPA: F0F1 ATP synthase subunit B [Patescibacteria group bacterium]|nr:F0F1 ATP synthase subunit B [Patescibacteria group bacterium]
MEIIKNFGLDPYLFGAQVINFLIVLYLLKRFLYKPVLGILKKREEEIREGLKQAEESRILLEKTLEKEKEILRKARESAKQTIDDAKAQSNTILIQAEDNSRKQAEKIILQAREQIELETKEAENRLASRISSLSIEFLKSALKGIFSEKEEKEILEKAMKQLRKN